MIMAKKSYHRRQGGKKKTQKKASADVVLKTEFDKTFRSLVEVLMTQGDEEFIHALDRVVACSAEEEELSSFPINHINSKVGSTLLLLVCEVLDHHRAVEHILSIKGVDPNMSTLATSIRREGFTPFFIACSLGDLPCVKMLNEKAPGLDRNATAVDGTSPFATACERGHNHVVQYLLSQKVPDGCIDYNAACDGGETGFLAAIEKRHVCTIKLLLADDRVEKHGALNGNGQNAMDLACATVSKTIIKMLKDAGMDPPTDPKLAGLYSLYDQLVCDVEEQRRAKKSECRFCRKKDALGAFQWCSRCQSVCYCSPNCQRADWKAGHKGKCTRLAASLARERANDRPRTMR